MRRALVEVLVLAVLCGVVSTVVFFRRLAFVADALTHTMFPGVAIAFFLGESLFIGALAAAVVSTVLLALLARQRRLDPDAVLALLIAAFFSVGVVVVSRRTSYQSDLTALLFGRLLAVDAATIVQSAAVAAVVLVILGRARQGVAPDVRSTPPAARALGYRVALLDVAVNVCVALVVVAAARAVGTALVVALLVTPAAAARLLTRRISTMAVVAVAVVAVAGYLGLVLSYDLSVHHDVRLAPGRPSRVLLTVGVRRRPRGPRPSSAVGRDDPTSRRCGRAASCAGRRSRPCWPAGWRGPSVSTSCCGGWRSSPSAMAHATFPGVVMAYWIGRAARWPGAFGFGWRCSSCRWWPSGGCGPSTTRASSASCWPARSALGVLLQGLQPRPAKELAALLAGQILAVDRADLVTQAVVAAVVGGLPRGRAQGVGARCVRPPPRAAALGYGAALDAALLLAVVAAVVTTVPAVGTILSVALVVVPALAARLWTDRLGLTFVLAGLIGAASGVVGLAASATWDIAAGGAIALTVTAAFVVSWLAGRHGLRATMAMTSARAGA